MYIEICEEGSGTERSEATHSPSRLHIRKVIKTLEEQIHLSIERCRTHFHSFLMDFVKLKSLMNIH